FSADGQRLVSCSRDHTAKIWDIPNRRERAILRGHAGWVQNAAFIRDGNTLVTDSVDRRVKLWNIHDLPSEDNLFAGRARVGLMRFSADGRFLASNGRFPGTDEGDDVAIWDLAQSNVTHRIKGLSIAFSSNTIAVISPTRQLQMWSLDQFTRVAGPCDADGET